MTKRRRHFGTLHLAALEKKKERPKDRRRSNKSKTNKLSRGLLHTQFSPSSTKSEDEKTSKRYLRTSHHTSSYAVSPCNDNELHFQQDIFWDPTYSPAKFGKGENKLAVSGHAVEISDIVNRIAPKDEKPAGPEVPLLEMWIGDNAIPCTPEVLRARPKKNRSSGVEDLLKLAKQFDRNMIQQDGEQYHDKDLENIFQHENEDQMESDMHEKGLPPLGELTGMKNSSFNSKDAGIQEEIQIKNSSQKSVDQEAEADINALFDGPTQLLSGRLSQTSSKSSHSSPERKCMFGAETNKVTKKSTCEGGVNFKFNKPPGFGIKPNSYQNTTQQCAIKRTTVSSSKPTLNGSEMASKSPVSSVSTNDFDDDDWGSDDLLDDSLVLEITQNPELIATPKGTHCSKQTGASITPNHQSVSGEETNKCIEHGSSVSSMLHSGLTSTESRQCGIDINPGEFQRINLAFEKVRNRASFMLHKNSQVQAGETSAENRSKQTDFCASNKPELQKDLHQQKVYTNETRFNKGSPSTPYKNIHNFQQVESGSSIHKPFKQQIATSSDSKSVNQSIKCQEIRVEAPKQTTSLVDDCNESRFSDGVLIDALDECDNLWGDVGDDDLFYQVCDDAEKLAEAQSTGLGTNIAPSSEKRNNTQPVTCPNKMKSGSAPSAVREVSAQSSYAAPENRNQNRSVGNSTNKPPATFNQANFFSTTFGNDSSINATSSLNQKTYTLNANSNQSVFVPSVNNNKSNTSKYVFTKLRSTCVEVLEKQCSQMTGLACVNRTYMQSYNKGTVQSHQSSSGITGASFKRHLSDSIALTSSKVFVTNQQNVKCSEEEIEKKKREALARRMVRQRDQ